MNSEDFSFLLGVCRETHNVQNGDDENQRLFQKLEDNTSVNIKRRKDDGQKSKLVGIHKNKHQQQQRSNHPCIQDSFREAFLKNATLLHIPFLPLDHIAENEIIQKVTNKRNAGEEDCSHRRE